jgi:hypothetical protein
MADAEEHYHVSAGGSRPTGVSGDASLNADDINLLSDDGKSVRQRPLTTGRIDGEKVIVTHSNL